MTEIRFSEPMDTVRLSWVGFWSPKRWLVWRSVIVDGFCVVKEQLWAHSKREAETFAKVEGK